MTEAHLVRAARQFAGSARFAQALTLLAVGLAFSTHLIRSLIGTPGLVAALVGLIALCAASLVARWRAVEWYGILPLTILVFVGWCAASVLWSNIPGTSVTRVAYLAAFTLLGVYVALMRDTIQIVRAFGDVLRLLLGLSLALEVLSGLLVNAPFPFLGIQGNIADFGPIQGIFGTRNLLGFVALIAAVTFVIEWRTKSVQRFKGIASIVTAGLCLVLAGSPTTYLTIFAVAIAGAALYGLRRADAATRWRWQAALLVTIAAALVVTWIYRVRVIDVLHARGEFEVRLDAWRELSRYLSTNPLQGWGWVGSWPQTQPYTWVELATNHQRASALSAYVDVYFQVGVIGGLLFIALLGLALVRSWLLASARRSVVYVWPALMLVVIATTSFAESFAIVEGGWMLLVVCTVKAARDMSWRDALAQSRPQHPLPEAI